MILLALGTIIWLFSPIVLIPFSIIYYKKYENLKATMNQPMHQQRQQQGQAMNAVDHQAAVQNIAQNVGHNVPQYAEAQAQQVQQQAMKQRAEQQAAYKERQATYRIQASMVVGVLLLLASALIFATTTWHIIPQIMKVATILSVSLIFYAASFLSGKKFKLEITSIAFYQLGCFFTPIAILCVGVFRLLGDWFSLEGVGAYFVTFVMAAVFSASTYIGYCIFFKRFFYYLMQASNCLAIFLLPSAIGAPLRVGVFLVCAYLLVITTRMCMLHRNEFTYYIQPCIAWACIYQGVYVFHPSLLVWATVVGIASTILYIAYYRLNEQDYISSNQIVTKCLCAATLVITTSVAVIELEHYHALFIIMTSYFAVTLLLIALRDRFDVAEILFYPVALVMVTCALATMGYYFAYKSAIVALWQVAILLFLTRRNWIHEAAFIIVVPLLPILTWLPLAPEAISMPYDAVIITITGLVYLAIGNKCFDRNRTLICTIGTVATYIGYIYLFMQMFRVNYELYDVMDPIIMLTAVWAVLLMVGAHIMMRFIDTTILLTPIQILILPLFMVTIYRLYLFTDENLQILFAIIAIVQMVIGRLMKRELVVVDEKRVESIHFISLSAIIGTMPAMVSWYDHIQYLGLFALFVYALQFYKRQHPTIDFASIGISLWLGYMLWMEQPFVSIPYDWEMEYSIVGVVIIIAILTLFSQNRSYIQWIQYGLSVLSTFVYAMECLWEETIVETLILGIAMVLVFFLAQARKELRWLVLSLVTITVLLFDMTKVLWMSIAWWVYLLIVGMILIGVAIYSESHKEREVKLKLPLPNWKW